MNAAAIDIRRNPYPLEAAFASLWHAAWGTLWSGDTEAIWSRSLAHFGAFDGARLLGYVNLGWDGGVHAFLLDTTVHPDVQHRGIGTRLVEAATEEARRRGVSWLHVDYEPQLEPFYRGCGFRPTTAGLLRLDS